MRFYDIKITDPKSGKLIRQFTSYANGKTTLGALNIELDIPVYRMAEPMGNATLRVWGISIQDIGQAKNFNGKNISVSAGMQTGLPLANPKQAGLILEGTINQCFGNWQDTNQTLDFVVVVLGGTQDSPMNIPLNWTAGMTLGDAVKNALAVAAPDFKCILSTSSDLVLNQDEKGFYYNLPQFAAYVKEVSQHILGSGASYNGVSIVARNNQFLIYDGTTPTTPKKIAFTDLIGQPAWQSLATMQFKAVMRADLTVGDYITMPQTQASTSAQSQSQFRSGSLFSGTFQIDQVRHMGNFRQPDGNSWVTVFDCHVP